MKATFFLLLVATVAFLALSVEAQPEEAAGAGSAVEGGLPGAAGGAGGDRGRNGMNNGREHGKGKGFQIGAEKRAMGEAHRENGNKGKANKGKGKGQGQGGM